MHEVETVRVKGFWYLNIPRYNGEFTSEPPVAKRTFSHIEVTLTGSRAKRDMKVSYPKGTKVKNFKIPLRVLSELERYHDAWEMMNKG